jgi:hypothetical protein
MLSIKLASSVLAAATSRVKWRVVPDMVAPAVIALLDHRP